MRTGGPFERSLSPVPATLNLEDVRQLNAVRERLMLAVRTESTYVALRTSVVQLACDIQDGVLSCTPEEVAADTVRSYTPPWEESAPSTPHASELGVEYGV